MSEEMKNFFNKVREIKDRHDDHSKKDQEELFGPLIKFLKSLSETNSKGLTWGKFKEALLDDIKSANSENKKIKKESSSKNLTKKQQKKAKIAATKKRRKN